MQEPEDIKKAMAAEGRDEADNAGEEVVGVYVQGQALLVHAKRPLWIKIFSRRAALIAKNLQLHN